MTIHLLLYYQKNTDLYHIFSGKILVKLLIRRLGSGENVFVVKDGVLITPPTHEGVLEGITRASILEFARARDIPVELSPLLRQDLYTADEAFFTGTAAEVVPIRSVDDRVIGPPGPITTALQEIFFNVVRGNEPKYDHMLDYVNQR